MSTATTAPIKQSKPTERPSWMVDLDRPRYFSEWKQAVRACRRNPKARPAYALRIVFADQFVGPSLNGFGFPAVIPRGTFRDLGFFQIDGDFEDELARCLYDDGHPGPREVHQIESGRIYLADNGVCERLKIDVGAWPIEAILAHAWELPGHDSHFVHASYDELAYQVAADLVTACREVSLGISAGAIAAFCRSFQVGAHLQDFFRRYGRTSRAKALAGDSGNPGRLADSAMYFAQWVLEKYARALDIEAARRPEKITGVVEDAAASISAVGEERPHAAKRGRPPIAGGQRNRAIVRIAQAIPSWESHLSEVAEALDASAIAPPNGHRKWAACWGGTQPRYFKRHIDAALKWCSDHLQAETVNSI